MKRSTWTHMTRKQDKAASRKLAHALFGGWKLPKRRKGKTYKMGKTRLRFMRQSIKGF